MKKEVLKKWAVVLLLGLTGAACGTDSDSGSEYDPDKESESSSAESEYSYPTSSGSSSGVAVYGGGSITVEQPGNPDAYEYNSQNCSSLFISDHTIANSCLRRITTWESVYSCRSKIAEFMTKYAGVRCRAEVTTGSSTVGINMLYDVDSTMGETLKRIDELLAEKASY